MRLTADQIAMIKELYAQNLTYAEIAERVGCSLTAAWYHSQSPENLTNWKKAHREYYRRKKCIDS